jgi:hypothetical protein
MDTGQIVDELTQQRDRVVAAIKSLTGTNRPERITEKTLLFAQFRYWFSEFFMNFLHSRYVHIFSPASLPTIGSYL